MRIIYLLLTLSPTFATTLKLPDVRPNPNPIKSQEDKRIDRKFRFQSLNFVMIEAPVCKTGDAENVLNALFMAAEKYLTVDVEFTFEGTDIEKGTCISSAKVLAH